jgi:hypothetical protein
MRQLQPNLANKYTFGSLLTNPLYLVLFIRDLYCHQKIAEAISFLVWELFHRLKLFKKTDYLTFEQENIIDTRSNTIFQGSGEWESNEILFFNSELKVERILKGWRNIFVWTEEASDKRTYWGNFLSDPNKLYKQDLEETKLPMLIAEFKNEINYVFISSENTIFVCTKGTIYCSNNNGKYFHESLKLSNEDSYILPTGITETPFKTIVIGEYGSIWDYEKGRWLKLPYLYYTNDRGITWRKIDFLLKQGINKHIHIIKYCKLLNSLILTDGDNKKKLWVSEPILSEDLEKIRWNLFNRFHIEMGGHTSILEEDKRILFGTDYLGGTNFILETNDLRKMKKQIIPDPYRRSMIESMTKIRIATNEQILINIKSSVFNSKCLVMYTVNGGETWNKYIEYDGSLFIITFCCSSNKEIAETYFNFSNIKDNTTNTYKISL